MHARQPHVVTEQTVTMKTTSVEETESAVRSTFGLEYTIRQRERGPFVTQLKAQTSGALVLLEHQFNNSFQTELVAPEGAILLLFSCPRGDKSYYKTNKDLTTGQSYL